MDVMLLAGQTETAVEHAQTLDAVSVHEIKPAQHGMPQRHRKFGRKSVSKRTRSQSTAQFNRTCFRCGSSSHLANAPICPATKVKCNNCAKVGHFARVCRSEKKVQLLDAPESEVPEIVHALKWKGNRCVTK